MRKMFNLIKRRSSRGFGAPAAATAAASAETRMQDEFRQLRQRMNKGRKENKTEVSKEYDRLNDPNFERKRKRQEQIHALELERTEKRARHQQQVKQLEVQLAAKDLALSQQALISSGRLNAAWRDAGRADDATEDARRHHPLE